MHGGAARSLITVLVGAAAIGVGCGEPEHDCAAHQVLTLVVTVADATTGDPICDATVLVAEAGSAAAGDPATPTANCAYEIQGLAPGDYDVHVARTGYVDVNGTTTIPVSDKCIPPPTTLHVTMST